MECQGHQGVKNRYPHIKYSRNGNDFPESENEGIILIISHLMLTMYYFLCIVHPTPELDGIETGSHLNPTCTL